MEPTSKRAALLPTSWRIDQIRRNQLLEKVRAAFTICFNFPGHEEPLRLLEREFVQLPGEMQADVVLWVFFNAVYSPAFSEANCAELDPSFLAGEGAWDSATLKQISLRLGASTVDPGVIAQKLVKLVPLCALPFALYAYLFKQVQNPLIRQLLNAILANPLHTDNYCFLKALRKDLIEAKARGGDIPKLLEELLPYLSPAAITALIEKLTLTEEERCQLARVLLPVLGKFPMEDLEKLLMYLLKGFSSSNDPLSSERLFLLYIMLGEHLSKFPDWFELLYNTIIPLAQEVREGSLAQDEIKTFVEWLKQLPPEEQLNCFEVLNEWSCFPHFWNTLRLSKDSDTPDAILRFLSNVAKFWPELKLREDQKDPSLRGYLIPPKDIYEQALYSHHFPETYTSPVLSSESVESGILDNKHAYETVLKCLASSLTDVNRTALRSKLVKFVTWVFNPCDMVAYCDEERLDSCLKLLYILTDILDRDPTAETDLLPVAQLIKGMLKIGCHRASNPTIDLHLGYLFIYRLGLFLEKAPRLQPVVYLNLEEIEGKLASFASHPQEQEWHKAVAKLKATKMNFGLEEKREGVVIKTPEEILHRTHFPHFLEQFDGKVTPAHLMSLDGVFRVVFMQEPTFTHVLKILPRSIICAVGRLQMEVGAPYNEEYAAFILRYADTVTDKDLIVWAASLCLKNNLSAGLSLLRAGLSLLRLPNKTEIAETFCQTADADQVSWLLHWQIEPWALELLIERAFELNESPLILERLKDIILPHLARKPEDYFTLRKLEVLFKWCRLFPIKFRLLLNTIFIESPLFLLIHKHFPPLVPINFDSCAQNDENALFWAEAAIHWPIKAPAYFPQPQRPFRMVSATRALTCLFDSGQLTEEEISEKFNKLIKSHASHEFIELKVIRNYPYFSTLVRADIPLFLSQMRRIYSFGMRPSSMLNLMTEMFEILGKVLLPGDTFDENSTKLFRQAVNNWLRVFASPELLQKSASRFMNVVPFIIALENIAKKAPALIRSGDEAPPFDLSAVFNYLIHNEACFGFFSTEDCSKDAQGFIEDFLGFMLIRNGEQAAEVAIALQNLRKLLPFDKNNKL